MERFGSPRFQMVDVDGDLASWWTGGLVACLGGIWCHSKLIAGNERQRPPYLAFGSGPDLCQLLRLTS